MEKETNGILKESAGIGVIVCRLQVPRLTNSHQKMIKTIISRHDRMIIFLGTTNQKITSKDPYPFEFRKQMVTEFLSTLGSVTSEKVTIVPLPDNTNNTEWVKNLDAVISAFLGYDETAHLYGGRDSFLPYYTKEPGKFVCTALEQEDYDSGTELRKITGIYQPTYSFFAAQAILWALRQSES